MSAGLVHLEAFGFDEARRRDRLTAMRLDDIDPLIPVLLDENVIRPAADELIEKFYEAVLEDPRNQALIRDDDQLARLRHTQSLYLLSLGQEVDRAEYFEDRLKIGLVHRRVGLPLANYHAAYAHLSELVLARIHQDGVLELRHHWPVSQYVVRVCSLDLSLATESYHRSGLDQIKADLETARSHEEALMREVLIDQTTGAASRRQLLSVLETGLAGAPGNGLCLIVADVDRFKDVNDKYGHPIGDRLLRRAVGRLKNTARDGDLLARYGGDEFMVVVEGGIRTAASVAERMRMTFVKTPFTIEDMALAVTISMGVAEARAGDTVERLIKRADEVLYRAKAAGRNRVLVADSPVEATL